MNKLIEAFGIEWPTILYVLINTVILVAGLSILLVRPVRKIMAARKAKADEIFGENERLNKEVVATRLKYEKMTEDAAQHIQTMMKESQRAAEDRAAQIVDEARRKAQELLLNSKKEIEAERARMERQLRDEVTSLAVDIAAKVLEREIAEGDNSKLVDEALSKWSS